MDDNQTDKSDTPVQDQRLSSLLATLRREPTPEADFESRFLADFHTRLSVQQKENSFFARLRRSFSSIWQNKVAWGTSFAGVALLCIAYASWFTGAPENDFAAVQSNANLNNGACMASMQKNESASRRSVATAMESPAVKALMNEPGVYEFAEEMTDEEADAEEEAED